MSHPLACSNADVFEFDGETVRGTRRSLRSAGVVGGTTRYGNGDVVNVAAVRGWDFDADADATLHAISVKSLGAMQQSGTGVGVVVDREWVVMQAGATLAKNPDFSDATAEEAADAVMAEAADIEMKLRDQIETRAFAVPARRRKRR